MNQTKIFKERYNKTTKSKSVRTISERLQDDVIVINKIEDITYDMFMNPELNSEFSKFDNESIVVNMDGSISVKIDIADPLSKPKLKESYVVSGASFGEVISTIYAIVLASYWATNTKNNVIWFEIHPSFVVKYLVKQFLNNYTKEDETKIHNMQDDVLDSCFKGVDNVKDVVERLKKYFK